MDIKSFKEFLIEQQFSPDLFIDEDGEYYIEAYKENGILLERRMKIKVNSKGVKTKRIICGKGRVLKTIGGRQVCLVQTGAAKAKKKIAVRKAIRTKKAKGPGYSRKINIKRQRGIKRRRMQGIRPGQ